MATEVDICNLALARLGDRATVSSIDPPEGSAQADHCARFYPIARDAILGAHPWRFAVKRATLPKMADAPVGEPASYFGLPSDCIRVVAVHCVGLENLPPMLRFYERTPDYRIEQVGGASTLVCEAENVWIEYVSSKTPAANFPSDFSDCLAWLLASYLAGTVIPGSSGIQVSANLMQYYQKTLTLAIQNDSAQRRETVQIHDPYAGDAGDSHAFD